MFDFLIENRDTSKDFPCANQLTIEVDDDGYKFFILQINGGFFLSQSLLVYPHLMKSEYPDAGMINDLLKREYVGYFDGLVSFGQDIFGNQFCFDRIQSHVILFNIEDASRIVMGTSFMGWLKIFEEDYDYYSGYSYALSWQESSSLQFDQRLCAKKPFVVGGSYDVSNFYASKFPDYLKSNAGLARQLHDLPDGTSVRIKITPPDN